MMVVLVRESDLRMDSVHKMDQECLFGCPHRKLEVVPHETDIGFGFSARKLSESTIWTYFSEFGHPKMDNQKFTV